MRLSLLPIFLAVVSVLFNGIQADPIVADCLTPDYKLGKCVSVRYCTTIMTALINNDHLTNSVVANYLRKSQCGKWLGSHEVCCDVSTIDMGAIGESFYPTTSPSIPQAPPLVRVGEKVEADKCGRLGLKETPLKWIGELWFETVTAGRTLLEAKCLGVLISHKHLVVPAHCVVALPDNVSLQFVEIRGDEFSVSKIFLHAGHDQPKYANDIAVIEIDKECDDDGICIEDGEPSVASTIGILKQAEIPSKYAKITLSPDNECNSHYNQFAGLSAGQFCAKVQSNDSDLSQIVSVVAIDTDNNRRHTLAGFTSTAIRNDLTNDDSKSFIFTNTRFHVSWVKAAIADSLKQSPRIKKIFDPVNTESDASSCQVSGADGFCGNVNQCSLFRDAPKPLSRSRVEFLKRIKCFTSSALDNNNVNEDGICCPLKYVELDYVEPERENPGPMKRGVEALDLKQCGRVETTIRIVGGVKAGLKEFPWVGLIKYKIGRINKFTCGSSLISSKHVLTCAHCITNLPAGYSIEAVRLGEYDRTTDPDCRVIVDLQECNPSYQDVPIADLIPHRDYNNPRYANDIGLVRLARAPDMTQGVIPVCLPVNAGLQETITEKFTVAGFGFTENGRDSDVLLKVVLPKVSKAQCQSMHSSIQLSEGHECYGGEGIEDSCKGDSGNPLMNYVNVDGKVKAVQMGIVAAGHSECGRGARGFPGIYTAVGHYMEWILNNVEE